MLQLRRSYILVLVLSNQWLCFSSNKVHTFTDLERELNYVPIRTRKPTKSPQTMKPTKSPQTMKPTKRPQTMKPTKSPQTMKPTTVLTRRPSTPPTYLPSTAPTAPPVKVCDTYTILGSNKFLDNKPNDELNTSIDAETAAMILSRLNGFMPPQDPANMEANYNPVSDAFCFNQNYPLLDVSSLDQQLLLYADYKMVFDQILMLTNDVSVENNGITNNRIPGMFLRMCFHDNSVDSTQPDFQDYVKSSIDPTTKKWIAEARYMTTSGADASVLICPEERFHPNQNYDQTASRVLKSIQSHLKYKYPMSYADLLHNGCNAATIYLKGDYPATALARHPFNVGRHDACFADTKCDSKYALCGPTELLPGLSLSAQQTSDWFTTRGMSDCLLMGLMSTHTLVDNMASMCPITHLTCTAQQSDVDAFTNTNKLYFQAGDILNFFSFFIQRGTHQTIPDTGDDSAPNCNWQVDGVSIPWPMTGIDCTLGLSNVEATSVTLLADVIKKFGHNPDYNTYDILQCALKVLGGMGSIEGGVCDSVIPSECKPSLDHKFGAFWG
jgi:Peroxidase